MEDFTLRSRVEADLEGGERLLWTGRPASIRVISGSLGSFAMGIVWTAFTVNFVVSWHSGQRDASGPGGLFGFHCILQELFFLPFLAIGFGMLSSPLWMYLRARRTLYAVTDRRVLVIVCGRSRTVRSYCRGDIGNIERTERADGSGDLSFARNVAIDGSGNQRAETVRFVGVADVRSVEQLLRRLSTGNPGPD